jgi:hypothetical protein
LPVKNKATLTTQFEKTNYTDNQYDKLKYATLVKC